MTTDAWALVEPTGVSRETFARLDIYVNELARWQDVKNLVGSATLGEVWTRHVVDSLQLLALAPDARVWLDLGSGAGFPGLVIAIAGPSGVRVHLVESNARKCAFLRHAARVTAAPVQVHAERLEAMIPLLVGQVDVVCARALAPLGRLLSWTAPLLSAGALGLFPKGRDWAAELTEARESWTFEAEVSPSRTDPGAGIVRITSLASAS